MSTNHFFRVSTVNSLNAAPLNYGLKCGLGSSYIRVKFQSPSLCADSLKRGDADIGLISSIEYARIPNIEIISRHCIASFKRVRSVLVLAKTPLSDVRTIAMDTSSRTSVVLGQILLRERYGVHAKVVDMAPNQVEMLTNCDAALLIGDPAMRAVQNGLLVIDLAEEWYNWTGLPFVFAVWAIRKDVIEQTMYWDIATLLNDSLKIGERNLNAIIDEVQPSIGWLKCELKEYLTKNICYSLGGPELSGLDLFYKKALQHGFITELKPIVFF